MRARLLLGLCVALVALLALPVAAQALSVKVVDTDGDPHVVDLADVAGQEDVDDVDYAIRSSSGTTTQTVTGFSLNQIIKLSGADPYNYTFLNVARPGSGSVQLTNAQVRNSGSPDGPPVVYDGGNAVGFIRPSTGDGDRNAADSFQVPGELVVTLQKGSPIGIEVAASETKIEAGDTVSFKATVSHPPTLEPSIAWSFDDGTPRVLDVDSVTHKFKTEGTYDVVVSATDPDNDQGPSATVEIQVGEKKDKGPDRRGGGKDKDDDAPDSGSSTGTGGGDTGSTYPGTYPGTTAPGTLPPSPVTPATPNQEPDKPEEPENAGSPDDRVSGQVLEDGAVVVTPPPEKTDKDEATPPTARTGSEEGGGFGIPGAALGGMSVIALLGVGALGQAGKIRPDAMLWHLNRLVGR